MPTVAVEVFGGIRRIYKSCLAWSNEYGSGVGEAGMSEIAVSWNGSAVRASFEASTREEFLAHVEKLTAFVDRVWPSDAPVDVRDETQELIKAVEARAMTQAAADRRNGPVVKKSWANMNAEERRVYRESMGLV